MNGQGTQLPFILRWRSALFVIPIWISFSPPVMSVTPLQASINSQFVVEATFTNMPSWGIEGFALPADIIQLYVHKNGYWYNLCGATTFSATWDTGSCPLRPAALTDIIIRLQVLNHQTSALTFVQGDQESGLANIITYAQPLPQAMAAVVENAVYGETEVLDLGMMINEHPARIYIQGNTFPSINSLDMKGAAIPGYKAELVSPTGWQTCEPVQLCSSITWKNASYLECLTNPCLDITCLPRQPNVKLYLGDLVGNTELQQKIVFPRSSKKLRASTMNAFVRLALTAFTIFLTASSLSVETADAPADGAAQGDQGHAKKEVIKMSQQQCKVQCQRFGMKRMGEAFKDITRPQDCVAKCEEVYKD